MAFNLNKAPRTAGRSVFYDKDAIDRGLRLLAYKWVPELFPNGRQEREGREEAWRVADISGRRPGEKGSCRIWLTGEHAGSWYDFEGKGPDGTNKGGPTSTLKNRLGIEKGELYEYAAALIVRLGGVDAEELTRPPPRVNGNGHHASAKAARDNSGLILTYLNNSFLIHNTKGEIYWNARKLGELPWSAYRSPDGEGYADLLFSPDATNFDFNHGTPALIHKLRFPNGEWTGAIQIIHIRDDASWHIGPDHPDNKRIAKKTWGPIVNGGVAMLAPIAEDGSLGIGEGIETTAAGMRLCGVPGWATCGTAGLVKFGEALLADRHLTAAIKRLLIWADIGKGGEATARRLASMATAAGVPRVELYMPGSGDDMAKDLELGLAAPEPITEHAPLDLALPPPADIAGSGEAVSGIAGNGGGRLAPVDVQRRLSEVQRGIMGDDLRELVTMIASAQLDDLDAAAALGTLARKTGIAKKTIETAYKQLRGDPEIIPPDPNRQAKPWLSQLATDGSGDPKGIMSNVAVVLREAEEIRGSLGFNEFTGRLWVTKKFPWEFGHGNPCDRSWNDADELAMMEWIQAFAGVHAPKGAIFDAVQRVANEKVFHPVQEYLRDVRAAWDGKPRIDTAAMRYFGARDTLYNREVLKRWLLSGVARIMRPGVKADSMVVFEGPQNLGKSTSIRVLFDPCDAGWFTDQLSEMGSKDASLELSGIWCAEYADLASMTRPETRVIKRFMSQTFDRFRPPYGRMPLKVERQCVFGGTTNDGQYLKDETGARRFWPFVCTAIDRNALIAERHEIWGEVVAMFETRQFRWWIDEQLEPALAQSAFAVTEARYQADAWESILIRWLSNNGRANVTTDELLRDGLEITDRSKWSKADQMRVGHVMRRMNWTRARDRQPPREYRYWRPGMLNLDVADPE